MSLLINVVKEIFSVLRVPRLSSGDGKLDASWSQEEFAKHMQLARVAFPGASYEDWLQWFHGILKPENYVEIGVETGGVLAYANSPTIAVGIDPDYKISSAMRAETRLFKETSDDFFRDHDLLEILGRKRVKFAFIDGLHTFDQALKDFINLERHSEPDTIILFHDVQPVIPETANRERHTIFWIGDTWKVMVILKKFRPDLSIISIPTYPSGLGVVTNLNPQSTTLKSHYDAIVAEAMEYMLIPYLESLEGNSSMMNNDFDAVFRQLEIIRPASAQMPESGR